jgi:hypothetical protein
MYYSVSDKYVSKIFSEHLKKVHLNVDANASRLNAIRVCRQNFHKICCLRDLVQVSEDYSNVWSMFTEQMLTNVVHND